jgi:hypothetical protein
MFFAAGAFFCFAFLLSTAFDDLWRPLLIACALAVIVGVCELALPEMGRYGVFRLMSGETYFLSGHVPWVGLLIVVTASAAMLYGAVSNVARRDF